MQQASRTTPGNRTGSSSSPILEYTKRTMMEAQAFRTAARLAELEPDARNEGKSQNNGEGGPPEQSSQVYPGTAARRNVTERRSRDRWSNLPIVEARTPEAVLARRSSRREKDKRYSLGADPDAYLREARPTTYDKKYGEGVMDPYPPLPPSPFSNLAPGVNPSGTIDRSALSQLMRRDYFGTNPNPMADTVMFTNPHPV